ncbi:MAG: helix-turn-helix domain-containing protein, partial [Clostridia bacterium]|nr:helix-turn-helix domain-containing protein [Clostridia bacterium]
MYHLSIFSERLKELMFDRNDMKSEALAKEIGTAGSTVRTWLNATNEISLENAIKVADFFHCSLDFLAGRTETDQTIIPRPLAPFYA